MHAHELIEQAQNAQVQQRSVGLTTSVIAVLLALATMLGNNANTKMIVDETKTADWWAYVAFHDTDARIYMSNEQLAQAEGKDMAAREFHKLYDEQTKESAEAKSSAQGLEYDSAVQSRRGLAAQIAALCLEVSIVLCSVALLNGMKLFWRLSFLTTAAGIWYIIAAYRH